MTQLFTYSYDVREEKPVDKSLFDLLSAKKGEWCAISIPTGPVIKKQPHWSDPLKKERFVYEDERVVAVNHPEPWYKLYEAEIFDVEKKKDYFINNKKKVVTVREGFSCGGFGHMDKIPSHRYFRFKGTIDEIVEEFRKHGYKFQSMDDVFKNF